MNINNTLIDYKFSQFIFSSKTNETNPRSLTIFPTLGKWFRRTLTGAAFLCPGTKIRKPSEKTC
jgi:hypothetical protein